MTPLAGRIQANIDGDRLTVEHALRADGVTANGTATIRIDNDEFRRSTLGGPSRVVVSSLAAADRALAPHGFRVPASVRDITGALDADVELSGTVGAPGATVHARAADLDLPGLGASAVTADVDANTHLVTVAPFTIRHGTTEAAGDVDDRSRRPHADRHGARHHRRRARAAGRGARGVARGRRADHRRDHRRHHGRALR